MDELFIGGDEKVMMNFLRCYSTPIDKTIQKNFYNIKFCFLYPHWYSVNIFLSFYCVRGFRRQLSFCTLILKFRFFSKKKMVFRKLDFFEIANYGKFFCRMRIKW